MGKGCWLVGAAVLAATASVHAQEKTMAYVMPYVGYTHLRIDRGRIDKEPDTVRLDALQVGASFGFRMPFGLLFEAGRSNSIHASIFDTEFELTQTYGAVGWRIPFADSWHLTPMVGREHWELSADSRALLDSDGVRHYGTDGWENFWQVSLSRELTHRISLGVNFKDVDQDFGHSRSGTFTATFAF